MASSSARVRGVCSAGASVSAPSARSADGRTGGTPQEEASGVEPEDAEPPHAPRTLADLEAILPDRS